MYFLFQTNGFTFSAYIEKPTMHIQACAIMSFSSVEHIMKDKYGLKYAKENPMTVKDVENEIMRLDNYEHCGAVKV